MGLETSDLAALPGDHAASRGPSPQVTSLEQEVLPVLLPLRNLQDFRSSVPGTEGQRPIYVYFSVTSQVVN